MIGGLNPLALASLAPLFSRKTADLSVKDIQSVADAFGAGTTITEEHKNLALSLLKAEDIDKVSDILAKPELIEKLKTFLTPPQAEPMGIIQCPHCLSPFLLQPQQG